MPIKVIFLPTLVSKFCGGTTSAILKRKIPSEKVRTKTEITTLQLFLLVKIKNSKIAKEISPNRVADYLEVASKIQALGFVRVLAGRHLIVPWV